jgi:hypothetical protein
MPEEENQVANEIKNYIDNEGLSYNGWYVGITGNIQERLFEYHKVGQNDWIYKQCLDTDAARRIEDYFVNQLNTQGDVGGGEADAVFVYAYRITSATVQ